MAIILSEAAEERWGEPVVVELSDAEQEKLHEKFRKLKEEVRSADTQEIPATWEDLQRTFTI